MARKIGFQPFFLFTLSFFSFFFSSFLLAKIKNVMIMLCQAKISRCCHFCSDKVCARWTQCSSCPSDFLLVRPLTSLWVLFPDSHCLIGLVVKASTSRAEDPGFDSCLCCGDFSRSRHISGIKIGTQMATLPAAWCHRVWVGTGRPSVSIL